MLPMSTRPSPLGDDGPLGEIHDGDGSERQAGLAQQFLHEVGGGRGRVQGHTPAAQVGGLIHLMPLDE